MIIINIVFFFHWFSFNPICGNNSFRIYQKFIIKNISCARVDPIMALFYQIDTNEEKKLKFLISSFHLFIIRTDCKYIIQFRQIKHYISIVVCSNCWTIVDTSWISAETLSIEWIELNVLNTGALNVSFKICLR